MNPDLYIIVRTRFLTEVKRLRDLGADEVIPEEFETSVEIFTRVLKKYLTPESTIDQYVQEVRADTYQMLRSPSGYMASISDLRMNLPNLTISTLVVEPAAPVSARTLGELNVRKQFSVTVLAIRRGTAVIENPSGDTPLQAGDEVVMIGTPDKIREVAGMFRPGEVTSEAEGTSEQGAGSGQGNDVSNHAEEKDTPSR